MPAAVPGEFVHGEPETPEQLLDEDLRFPSRLQLTLAADNPFMDFRRQGDPGGVGYQRLQSQVLLVDAESVGIVIGFSAVSPAGLDSGGLRDGPTSVMPNLTWVWAFSESISIQGFVGQQWKGLAVDERDVQYGLSLQSPIADDGSVHVFFQALGGATHRDDLMEWLPGLHWKATERSWLTAGFLLGQWEAERQWQVSCSWQY